MRNETAGYPQNEALRKGLHRERSLVRLRRTGLALEPSALR